MQSKGLGDTIHKITKKTGLKTISQIAAKAIGFVDCGCDRRRAWLNKQFSYKHK